MQDPPMFVENPMSNNQDSGNGVTALLSKIKIVTHILFIVNQHNEPMSIVVTAKEGKSGGL